MEKFINYGVHTDRGLANSSNINIGDMVYNYISGELMEVKNKIMSPVLKSAKILYSGNRSQMMLDNDLLFNGSELITLDIDNIDSRIDLYGRAITQPVLRFDGIIREPLPIDPYIFGIFYAYGDFLDKYANIPIEYTNRFYDVIQSGDFLSYFAIDNRDRDKCYFTNEYCNRITWDDLFKNFDKKDIFYINENGFKYNSLPYFIKYATINDRLKFIRGIFDIGYDKDVTYNIQIKLDDIIRAVNIRDVLVSLGIISNVYYVTNDTIKCYYILYINRDDSKYPGLFYNIDNIEYKLDQDNKILDHDKPDIFSILLIQPHENTWMYKLQFEEHNQLFLSDNFLPRVSM